MFLKNVTILEFTKYFLVFKKNKKQFIDITAFSRPKYGPDYNIPVTVTINKNSIIKLIDLYGKFPDVFNSEAYEMSYDKTDISFQDKDITGSELISCDIKKIYKYTIKDNFDNNEVVIEVPTLCNTISIDFGDWITVSLDLTFDEFSNLIDAFRSLKLKKY